MRQQVTKGQESGMNFGLEGNLSMKQVQVPGVCVWLRIVFSS